MSKQTPKPPASNEPAPVDLHAACRMSRTRYGGPLTLRDHQAEALNECLQGLSVITGLLGLDEEDVLLDGYLKGGLIAAQAQLVDSAQRILEDCEERGGNA